jgi:homoserine O-acetyltransferase
MANHIKAKILVIVAVRDAMVNPHSAMEFAKVLNTNYVELTGDCGHLAPGCEGDKVRKAIIEFL